MSRRPANFLEVHGSRPGAFAAAASGLALPIAEVTSWRIALAAWLGLAVLATLLWLLRMRLNRRRHQPRPAHDPSTSTGAGEPQADVDTRP